ncbi:MAG: universal stress protein [Alphaproteobacteria bacterium]|nr:universal stress protein [Alphaproteobacteria bacterium]
MAYRVVLVPMTGDPADPDALKVTRAVVDQTRAHVVGVHVRDPIGVASRGGMFEAAYLTPGLIESLRESGRASATAARDTFNKWQAANGIETVSAPPSSDRLTAEWIEADAPVSQEIARRARIADLTVLARSGRQYAADSDQALHGALVESGRPVLLVPGAGASAPLDTIVIAWNDSRESALAVAAAWPLIARARRLVVFVGGDDEALRASADGFVAHLAWRGHAAASIVTDPHADVGAGLLLAAEREKAGLIVMGAYSHSRLQRFVFGGATDYVLRHATLPVLMTH